MTQQVRRKGALNISTALEESFISNKNDFEQQCDLLITEIETEKKAIESSNNINMFFKKLEDLGQSYLEGNHNKEENNQSGDISQIEPCVNASGGELKNIFYASTNSSQSMNILPHNNFPAFAPMETQDLRQLPLLNPFLPVAEASQINVSTSPKKCNVGDRYEQIIARVKEIGLAPACNEFGVRVASTTGYPDRRTTEGKELHRRL